MCFRSFLCSVVPLSLPFAGGARIVQTDILSKNAIIHTISSPIAIDFEQQQQQSQSPERNPQPNQQAYTPQPATPPTCVHHSSRRCVILDNLPRVRSSSNDQNDGMIPSPSFFHPSNRISPLDCTMHHYQQQQQNATSNVGTTSSANQSGNRTVLSVCADPTYYACENGYLFARQQTYQPQQQQQYSTSQSSSTAVQARLPLALQRSYRYRLATPSEIFEGKFQLEVPQQSTMGEQITRQQEIDNQQAYGPIDQQNLYGQQQIQQPISQRQSSEQQSEFSSQSQQTSHQSSSKQTPPLTPQSEIDAELKLKKRASVIESATLAVLNKDAENYFRALQQHEGQQEQGDQQPSGSQGQSSSSMMTSHQQLGLPSSKLNERPRWKRTSQQEGANL